MTGDTVDGDGESDAAGPQTGQRAAYVDSLDSLDASLDRVVMASDVDRQTPHSLRDIVDTFGSWEAALEAADIDVRAQIRDELARLHAELGHPPTPDEVNEHGYISATMVENHFDSFDAALDHAVDPAGGPAEAAVASARRVLAGGRTLSRATVVSARRTHERLARELGSLADRVGTTATDRFSGAGDTLRGSLRSANRIDPERRRFLKYATLSVTLAATTSSSDLLFGGDKLNAGLQRFGYGGPPLETDSQSGTDRQDSGGASGGTATPASVATATPAQTGGTQTPDGGTTSRTTPDAGGTQSSTDGSDTDTASAGTDAGGTAQSPTNGSGTDTTSTETDSGNTQSSTDGSETETDSGNTQSSTDGSETETTTETPETADSTTSIDRYDDLQDTGQDYGEEGYGGYTTA